MNQGAFNLLYKYRYYIFFAAFALLLYFPLFMHLDFMTIRLWDESVLGVNAVEMQHNHNYIVTYYLGKPDVFNCKPPFMIWCIVACSKFLGFNELSLRLPSALAGLLLCLYLFYFLRRYTSSTQYGFFVAIVLLTCQGFVRNHVTRTGEYDAMLTLFCTLFSLHLFFAVQASEKRTLNRHLFLFFVFLTLSVLTKSIVGLMFGPGLLLYVAINKRVISFLKSTGFYMGLLFFIVFGIGYFPLRESMNPGYIHAVLYNDMLGRFSGVNEGHTGTILYYLHEMVNVQFVNYMFIFPAAVCLVYVFGGPTERRLTTFALIAGGGYLLLISIAKSKLPHYDAPVFPFLAIVTAFFFYYLGQFAVQFLTVRGFEAAGAATAAFAICFLLLLKPYNDIVRTVYFPEGDEWDKDFTKACLAFQDQVKRPVRLDHYKWLIDQSAVMGSVNVFYCYKEILAEHNIKAPVVDLAAIGTGDSVLVFYDSYKQDLYTRFNVDTVVRYPRYNAQLLYINTAK